VTPHTTDEEFHAAINAMSKTMFDVLKSRAPMRFDIAVGSLLHLLDMLVRSAPASEREPAAVYAIKAIEELARHIAEHSCGLSRPAGPLN
jgi:hypothetical protein